MVLCASAPPSSLLSPPPYPPFAPISSIGNSLPSSTYSLSFLTSSLSLCLSSISDCFFLSLLSSSLPPGPLPLLQPLYPDLLPLCLSSSASGSPPSPFSYLLLPLPLLPLDLRQPLYPDLLPLLPHLLPLLAHRISLVPYALFVSPPPASPPLSFVTASLSFLSSSSSFNTSFLESSSYFFKFSLSLSSRSRAGNEVGRGGADWGWLSGGAVALGEKIIRPNHRSTHPRA